MARFLILVVAGIIAGPISASAAEKWPCGVCTKIVEIFEAKHKEVGQARGLASNTRTVEAAPPIVSNDAEYPGGYNAEQDLDGPKRRIRSTRNKRRRRK